MTLSYLERAVQFSWVVAVVVGGFLLLAYAAHGVGILWAGWRRGRRARRRMGVIDLVGVDVPTEVLAAMGPRRVFDWADEFEWEEGA